MLTKKITEPQAELGWWIEFRKLLVEDEHRKCDRAACWPPSFVDRNAWHDSQRQDCRADLEEQIGTALVPLTQARAQAFMFDETTGGVLQYAPSD